MLYSFVDPFSLTDGSENGHFTVNATVTVQNGSTGSAQFACRLAQRSFNSSLSPGKIHGATPWNYETAVKGHPATVAMTGVLFAALAAPSFSDNMAVQCRASSGTNVHVTDATFVAVPVSGSQGISPTNRHSAHPHNRFIHPRRTARK